jgi:hypothetical protein
MFDDYIDHIYDTELKIKDSTDTARMYREFG